MKLFSINSQLFLLTFLLLTLPSLSLSKKAHHRSSNKRHHAYNRLQSTDAPEASNTKQTISNLSPINTPLINTHRITNNLPSTLQQNLPLDLNLLTNELADLLDDLKLDQISPDNRNPKATLEILINDFQNCDTNKDNQLTLDEFKNCWKNDKSFKYIQIPSGAQFGYRKNETDADSFSELVFGLTDENYRDSLNVYSYTTLRLMTFAWRQCGTMNPFMSEAAFECAINIILGLRNIHRNTARKIYDLAIELGNNRNVREIDFIAFLLVALPARLYSKVNNKKDKDMLISEAIQALNRNILPRRYNSDTVTDLFKLTAAADRSNDGIDLYSFIFYDNALRLFFTKNAEIKYRQNKDEFIASLSNYFMYNMTMVEISKDPFGQLTNNSLIMYQFFNQTLFNGEENLFRPTSFLELQGKKAKRHRRAHQAAAASNKSAVNITALYEKIYKLLDSTEKNSISFYQYANFYVFGYIWTKVDDDFRYRILAGKLYDSLSKFDAFPKVSTLFNERARYFNSFNQDLYFDFYLGLVVMIAPDQANNILRKTERSLMTEVEFATFLAKVGLEFVPNQFWGRCLRGVGEDNVPRVDWECGLHESLNSTLKSLEAARAYLDIKKYKLNLSNTVFVNVDPSLNA